VARNSHWQKKKTVDNTQAFLVSDEINESFYFIMVQILSCDHLCLWLLL